MPEQFLRVKLERCCDAGIEYLLVALAGDQQHEVALGADHGERWPTTHADLTPHSHLIVVHDRMGDLVAQDCIANVRGDLFVFKFGRVHTYECHRIPGVAFLQLDEIGEDMDAVDAAIRPEIEHHNFSGELFAE